ncbi:MAG: EamA family transporter [candidate division WOR-3 bacterium]
MRTAMMIAISVLAGSGGDVCITRGMKQVGEISTLNPRKLGLVGRKVFRNRSFLTGVGLMAISFFAFLNVLSWADLSFVVPATSLSYVVSTFGAALILKERVSLSRWAGIFLVCLGVSLVSLP